MKWSEVTAAPNARLLRQFAGLCLVVFGGIAAYRAWHGLRGPLTIAIAAGGGLVGIVGLLWPPAVRWVYTGWMIVAFPIGWVLSRVIMILMFGLMFVPVALFFKMIGRDELHLRRGSATSYWSTKPRAQSAREYLRQS